MDIKNDYIAKARIYVEEEGNKVKRLDALRKDLEILKKDLEGRKSRGLTGNSTTRSIKGIDDLILARDREIERISEEIKDLEHDKQRFENVINRLEDLAKKVIEARYVYNKRYNKSEQYEFVAEKLKMSESTVKRFDRWALKEIAFIKYGMESVKK
ncbi:hypothetical protein [Romboutsia timonensis]|uniref:hypothetical protein n=1 Tax=Romboutsia timonensis TaxID=1776391 RepID=UPI002A82F76D|nr:hypothetical protein [Romboutsia timonensis]MDY3960180.1 hypothetical protein [Romboutsia timonensis]